MPGGSLSFLLLLLLLSSFFYSFIFSSSFSFFFLLLSPSSSSSKAREAPDTVVGLIAFNSVVTVFGDCTREPVVLQGDVLDDFETLLSFGEKSAHLSQVRLGFSVSWFFVNHVHMKICSPSAGPRHG